MQPTARVNRVLHNKPGTLVVDIFGPAYPGSTETQRSPASQLRRPAR